MLAFTSPVHPFGFGPPRVSRCLARKLFMLLAGGARLLAGDSPRRCRPLAAELCDALAVAPKCLIFCPNFFRRFFPKCLFPQTWRHDHRALDIYM